MGDRFLMHVGVTVADVEESVAFYTRLFGQRPTLQRPDYAKWRLDDPAVTFSINTDQPDVPLGVSHLGIQVGDGAELERARAALDGQGLPREDQDDLVCGWQLQDKSWVFDPQGVPWEVFHTRGVVDHYGTNEFPTTAGEPAD